MSARQIRTVAMIVFAPLLLFFSISCYESKYTIGSLGEAGFDKAYVGDYAYTDKNESDSFVIRNLDGKQYYAEFCKKGDEPLRMVGFLGEVNGVTFANLRNLPGDGSISNDYLITRVGLSADHSKLLLRDLNEDFFKDKKVESKAALGKLIAENLENDDMYDGPAIAATRVATAK